MLWKVVNAKSRRAVVWGKKRSLSSGRRAGSSVGRTAVWRLRTATMCVYDLLYVFCMSGQFIT